ncbi:MAG: sigma-70 family RNA polymerase sigma factor [Saprospiraceae bacterium]|nr:sigma-70 family RNA polymerase sigma factor [Saprospiraceae bacterium]
MPELPYSDSDLIDAFHEGGIRREKALRQIYQSDKLHKTIVSYVLGHGGNSQDAEDVFQDTIILFDRQLREGNFKGQSSLATYFMGIAKWRWVSIRRKFGGDLELKPEQYDAPIESVEARVIEDEKREIIDEILSKIGERCKTILKLYKLSYSMEEIAAELKLSSPEMAKKNAYECRKKFKDFVGLNPHYKTILNIDEANS